LQIAHLLRNGSVRGGALIAVAAALSGSCRARADQAPAQQQERRIVWKTLGSWSGGSSTQTESFTSDTGTLRVRWETTARASDSTAAAPAMFRLTAHSAISGRPLQQVVEHAGPGSGVGYVQQDPHVFYMVVEANRLDWKFTVEEGIGYP
jgi:hypothetical protein